MGTEKQLKNLAKDTAIYGSGEAFLKVFSILLSFITVPIFTRIFNTADYGLMELLGNISCFLAPLMILTFDQAIVLLYYELKTELEKKRMITTGYFIILVWSIILLACLSYLSEEISYFFTEKNEYALFFQIIFISAVSLSLVNYGKTILRITFKPGLFSLISVCSGLSANLAGLILVIAFGFRILGIFSAAMTINILTALATLYFIKENFTWNFSLKYGINLIKIGIPLMFSSIILTVNSLTDRYFIIKLLSMEDMGLYSIGFKFASILAMILTWFGMAFAPNMLKNYYEGEEYRDYFKKIYYYLFSFFFITAFFICSGSRVALYLLTPPLYHSAHTTVSALSLSMVYTALFIITMAGFQIFKRVKLLFFISVIQLLLNIILNLLLIPVYGINGAAVATAISSGLFLFGTALCSQKMLTINFLISSKIIFLYILYSGILMSFSIFTIKSVWLDFATKFFISIIMAFLIYLFKLIEKDDLKNMLKFLKLATDKFKKITKMKKD